MKKIFILFLTIFLISVPVYAEEKEDKKAEEPKVVAQGAILIDYGTGRVLWGKNETEPMAMASTTKIMTAILAIESGKLDETVVASKNAALAPKVRMNLQVGEEHRLEDLLYALMLQSSNDAAVAIAEHIGGSVENFCNIMTKKAIEIGAKDTVFETPNGLDKGNHHSTAYDMALITKYALANEKFVKIINTKEITIPIKGENQKSYHIYNKNRLLSEYEGAMGVKTGYTGKAGQCFVGAANRGDTTLISVVLASGWGTQGKEQKWKDTKAILNYGFENFNRIDLIDKGKVVKILPVAYSKEGEVSVSYKDNVSAVLSSEEVKNLKIQNYFTDSLEAPIYKGQKVGTAKAVLESGEVCGETDIIADSEILRHDFNSSVKKMFNNWLKVDLEKTFN